MVLCVLVISIIIDGRDVSFRGRSGLWFLIYMVVFFFFFSSRRRHTRLQGDWSSDVCSSDLSSFKVIRQTERRFISDPRLGFGGSIAHPICRRALGGCQVCAKVPAILPGS